MVSAPFDLRRPVGAINPGDLCRPTTREHSVPNPQPMSITMRGGRPATAEDPLLRRLAARGDVPAGAGAAAPSQAADRARSDRELAALERSLQAQRDRSDADRERGHVRAMADFGRTSGQPVAASTPPALDAAMRCVEAGGELPPELSPLTAAERARLGGGR